MDDMLILGTNARFQSTLPRGERHYNAHINIKQYDFNPRSREGSDQNKQSCLITYLHFNPRSREGSDVSAQGAPKAAVLFQSTLPRGERRCSSPKVSAVPLKFQSTLPRGERLIPLTFSYPLSRFQSTLPRGERLHLLTFFRLQYGYILFHLTNKYSFCF